MTSLREEIFKLFWEVRHGKSLAWQHDYYYADKVISKFEKRIDEAIEDIKRDAEFVSKNNLFNPSHQIEAYHLYKLKEMLK